jgi:hypothetical protein
MIKIYRFNDLKCGIWYFKCFVFYIKYAIIESYNCVAWVNMSRHRVAKIEKNKQMEIKL